MTTMFSPADNFGVYDMLPDMGGFLGDIRFYLCLFLLIVPILMAAMGALRFFRPAREANRFIGYRTYFGMGSVYAWRVTQWVSGAVFMGIGAVLLLIAIIVCIVMGFQSVSDAVFTVFIWLIVEGVCLLLSVAAVEGIIFYQFDRQGNLRQGRNLFFLRYVPYKPEARRAAPVVATEPEPEPEPQPEEQEISDQELFTQEDFFDFDALLADNSVPTENPKNKE